MALAFDAYPPRERSSAAANATKLRDESHRLLQRLVRARESYQQDFLSGDPEVPLDQQLAVIESYSARLDVLTEQLRQHDSGELPAAAVPERPAQSRPQQFFQPEAPLARPSEPVAPAPVREQPRPTGTGIANPDGTPLAGDGGRFLRTEEAAVGEYVRHSADQRWLIATGRPGADDLDEVCDGILAALAHKHGVSLEDERKQLARQVDTRYRRDYG